MFFETATKQEVLSAIHLYQETVVEIGYGKKSAEILEDIFFAMFNPKFSEDDRKDFFKKISGEETFEDFVGYLNKKSDKSG